MPTLVLTQLKKTLGIPFLKESRKVKTSLEYCTGYNKKWISSNNSAY
jgi:hypothetical protein